MQAPLYQSTRKKAAGAVDYTVYNGAKSSEEIWMSIVSLIGDATTGGEILRSSIDTR
jgi:hypothetical protein